MKKSITLALIAAWCLVFSVGVFAQPVDNITGLRITKPAGSADGVDTANGGLYIKRDASGLVGGAGNINSALSTRCYTGPWSTAFEWCVFQTHKNESNTGENVVLYLQGDKRGYGPTFGQVTEMNDTTGDNGALVAHEYDVMVSGADPLIGSRVGIDLICGDARKARNLTPSLAVGCSAGIRIQPWGQSTDAKWTRGIHLHGKYIVGIDLADAVSDASAIRLGEGQKVALEGTGQVTVHYLAGKVRFMNGATKLMELDIGTGNLQIKGQYLGGLQ